MSGLRGISVFPVGWSISGSQSRHCILSLCEVALRYCPYLSLRNAAIELPRHSHAATTEASVSPETGVANWAHIGSTKLEVMSAIGALALQQRTKAGLQPLPLLRELFCDISRRAA